MFVSVMVSVLGDSDDAASRPTAPTRRRRGSRSRRRAADRYRVAVVVPRAVERVALVKLPLTSAAMQLELVASVPTRRTPRSRSPGNNARMTRRPLRHLAVGGRLQHLVAERDLELAGGQAEVERRPRVDERRLGVPQHHAVAGGVDLQHVLGVFPGVRRLEAAAADRETDRSWPARCSAIRPETESSRFSQLPLDVAAELELGDRAQRRVRRRERLVQAFDLLLRASAIRSSSVAVGGGGTSAGGGGTSAGGCGRRPAAGGTGAAGAAAAGAGGAAGGRRRCGRGLLRLGGRAERKQRKGGQKRQDQPGGGWFSCRAQ